MLDEHLGGTTVQTYDRGFGGHFSSDGVNKTAGGIKVIVDGDDTIVGERPNSGRGQVGVGWVAVREQRASGGSLEGVVEEDKARVKRMS